MICVTSLMIILGRVDRFVQSVKTECLDHCIGFSQDPRDYLMSKIAEHDNSAQPNSKRNRRPPCDQSEAIESTTTCLEAAIYLARL